MTTYSESGQLQPKEKDSLDWEVPREVIEDHAEGGTFDKIEEGENDPVCEPLNIVIGGRRLDGSEGEEGRDNKADQIGDGCRKGIHQV